MYGPHPRLAKDAIITEQMSNDACQRTSSFQVVSLVATTLILSACSGGDAEQRVELDRKPEFASPPIDSPDTESAFWSGGDTSTTLRFGKPGNAPLFSIDCSQGRIILTRHAPADAQASALMPLIGNGRIERVPVDAVNSGEGYVWQGQFPANDDQLDVFAGSRSVEATVPGAGTIDLAASSEPGALIARCRGDTPKVAPLPAQ